MVDGFLTIINEECIMLLKGNKLAAFLITAEICNFFLFSAKKVAKILFNFLQ
jgi:hypothetical protein